MIRLRLSRIKREFAEESECETPGGYQREGLNVRPRHINSKAFIRERNTRAREMVEENRETSEKKMGKPRKGGEHEENL